MNIVVPMGYMGSGSSAITDILRGFEGYEAAAGTAEFLFTHCPNGLFDLEDKLLQGNNALRSDEAIHSFLFAMEDFCRKNRWWGAAGFTKGIERRFLDATYAFINDLIDFEIDAPWYHQHDIPLRKVPLRACSRIVRSATHGSIRLPSPLRYKGTFLAFPKAEEFYVCARSYINRALSFLGSEDNHLILDQLLLPHNLWRLENYFEEKPICFVVDRDPRDVFLLNKYIWSIDSVDVPFPKDAQAFCEYYRKMREAERPVVDECIHRLHFEDLVYRNGESIRAIMEALGNPSQRSSVTFSPKQSIDNTQLFSLDAYRAEGQIIADQLPEFLYEFPYERQPAIGQSF